MIILRDVLKRAGTGIQLIAETTMTQDEFDQIRTQQLIMPDLEFDFPTIVYWFEAGNPPVPVYRDCPEHWRGKVFDPEAAIRTVNRKTLMKWWLKYKPPVDSSGETYI